MEKEYINIEPIKVQEEDLKLVYINPVGETHNGSQKLEFIFSNNPDDCIGPQWEDVCDLGVYPPRKGFIGRQAPSEILDLYRNTRLPALKKGAASPIRYLSPQGEFDQ